MSSNEESGNESLEERLQVLEARMSSLEAVVRDYCSILNRTSLVPVVTSDSIIHFILDSWSLCVDLAVVEEIFRMVSVSPLPGCPSLCSGIIIVRGHSIPILNVRGKLGLPEKAPDLNTQILLITIDGFRCAIIVDNVLGVTRLDMDSLESTPSLPFQSSCVTGLVRKGDQILYLINPLLLLTPVERDQLKGMLLPLAGSPTVGAESSLTE